MPLQVQVSAACGDSSKLRRPRTSKRALPLSLVRRCTRAYLQPRPHRTHRLRIISPRPRPHWKLRPRRRRRRRPFPLSVRPANRLSRKSRRACRWRSARSSRASSPSAQWRTRRCISTLRTRTRTRARSRDRVSRLRLLQHRPQRRCRLPKELLRAARPTLRRRHQPSRKLLPPRPLPPEAALLAPHRLRHLEACRDCKPLRSQEHELLPHRYRLLFHLHLQLSPQPPPLVSQCSLSLSLSYIRKFILQ